MTTDDKICLIMFLILLTIVGVCIGVSITSHQSDKDRCASLGGIYHDGACFRKETLYF